MVAINKKTDDEKKLGTKTENGKRKIMKKTLFAVAIGMLCCGAARAQISVSATVNVSFGIE